MYVLFDKTKIDYLAEKNAANSDGKIILIALKYFDIFTQKLYFVHWLLVKTCIFKFSDIIKSVEQRLIEQTKHKRSHYRVLYNYNNEINEYEGKHGKKEDRYVIFEEEATLRNKGTRDNSVCKVNDIALDDVITDDYFDGDMFVFQLNAYHQYFDTFTSDTLKKIMNRKKK
eukprot:329641_1